MTRGLFIILVAICIAHAHAQSLCSPYTGSTLTFIPNPTDCASWFACSKGQVANKGRCPEGNNFDSVTKMCVAVASAKCASSAAMDVCKGKADKISVANPIDCTQYYYCLNQIGYLGQCNKDYIFDASRQLCIYSSTQLCKSNFGASTGGTKYSCATVPPGSFVPKEKSCDGYYYCGQNGVATLGQCDSGFYFDAATQKCDFSKNVQCEDEEDTSSKQLSVVPSPQTTCQTINAKATPKMIFVSDPGDCSSYYYCPNGKETTSLIKGSCPDGKFFDEGGQSCKDIDLKNEVQCPKRKACYDKPIGYFDIGKSCDKFNYCGPEAQVVEGSCPDGYNFDVEHQHCNKKSLVKCQILFTPNPRNLKYFIGGINQ